MDPEDLNHLSLLMLASHGQADLPVEGPATAPIPPSRPKDLGPKSVTPAQVYIRLNEITSDPNSMFNPKYKFSDEEISHNIEDIRRGMESAPVRSNMRNWPRLHPGDTPILSQDKSSRVAVTESMMVPSGQTPDAQRLGFRMRATGDQGRTPGPIRQGITPSNQWTQKDRDVYFRNLYWPNLKPTGPR